jgi:hypothetical protein
MSYPQYATATLATAGSLAALALTEQDLLGMHHDGLTALAASRRR